jgi:hypothetical protein
VILFFLRTQPLNLRDSVVNLAVILPAASELVKPEKSDAGEPISLWHGKNIPRKCRVMQSFEPACAGGPRPRNAALAQAYRVIPVETKVRCMNVGSKPLVQYHEHSRAQFLYHKATGWDREKLNPALLPSI